MAWIKGFLAVITLADGPGCASNRSMGRVHRFGLGFLVVMGLAAGCSSDVPSATQAGPAAMQDAASRETPEDASMAPVAPPLPATYQRPALCDRDQRSDIVRDVFCKEPGQHIASLAALESALGLSDPKVLGTVYGGAVAL